MAVSNGHGLPIWKKFAAFEVFGDYAPSQGAFVLVRVGTQRRALHQLLRQRSATSANLDPELARAVVRAGLGLLRTGLVRFAYATVEEVIVVLRPEVANQEGAPIDLHSRLVSEYSATLTLLLGTPVRAEATIFEVPDATVAQRGLAALAEDVEETTPLRSALWLGAQLEGRGQPFHRSMIETLEEQSDLLQANGIDMDALPGWWWRGMAAAGQGDDLRLYEELPRGDELDDLVAP